ncbi:carbamoyltransferase HypF [Actinoplanes sp. NPDC024001]|uniref:carbamoyltransferase HypF n=1 Tax=Actinoplanes sp. NPDC024001 TaxID=3154598 RepID=UPI003403F290
MCLGIPGRVREILPGNEGQLALVDVAGAGRRVNVGMLDSPPQPGDWVLIHLGFAMEIIDEAQASRAMTGLQLMGSGPPARIRRRFTVRGLVQGVGFRPFAYVTAAELALSGEVANTADGVIVEVEGEAEAVTEYGRRLRTSAPPLAMVTAVDEADLPPAGGTGFTIATSDGSGTARTLASPDVATCADCRRELRDPAGRRFRHPFITCTNCGPRFTIIDTLPYDRAATTMAGFPMCEACRAEYDDPADRRFHAQPIACPDCGPRLELVTAGPPARPGEEARHGEDALREARRMLAAGAIVAVKGLGGYHLACDARNESAVTTLRDRKRRGGKPFAVMVADLATARELVTLTDAEEALLTGVRRPIVLLPRRDRGRDRPETGVLISGAHRGRNQHAIADAVAPDHTDLGVMLPYTPVHELLFGLPGDPPGPDALVMTSGNLAGEPIAADDRDALVRLAPLADAWLRHDRAIRVPCDDSVTRHAGGAELPVRRSRGYAPLPVSLPFELPPALAVGADLKNTCAIAAGRYAWASQHIGDLDDLAGIDALTASERHLERLTGIRPELLIADLHPGYHSTGWARAHAAGRPLRLVQHHHAHIAAVLAEHGVAADEQVIGFAFDGTGYGTDGAVWGGEVLIAGYKAFRRVAYLGYVPLAGGDASVRRPYRMALSHLRAAGVPWWPALPPVAACPPAERHVLDRQFGSGFGCVPTSSMGRLFDAVAALAGVRQTVEYEAEAAMILEGLAARHGLEPHPAYVFELRGDVADPGPVIRAVAADVRGGVSPVTVAARFHAAVAGLIVRLAERCREQTGLGVVALGGGVFQNALLLAAAEQDLAERGFRVLRPRLLPPSDGGIALGQLAAGAT